MGKEKIIYGVKVKLKSESKFMKFLGWLLKPINPKFMTSFWTTLFTTVYAPSSFKIENEAEYKNVKSILEHEKIHVDDFKKHHIWFILTYFFPPFIFAYGRFYWERKAYLPELLYLSDVHAYTLFYYKLNLICDNISGGPYLYAWPRPWVKKWFLKQTNMPDEST